MGLYDTFQTDDNLEQNGIWVDYGDFRVKIAAASSKNKKYEKVAERRYKPVRKLAEVGALSSERAQQIVAGIYAEAVVLDWETRVKNEWKKGIEAPEGDKLLPVNQENVESTLMALPRLLQDLQEQAGSMVNFQNAEKETERGNS